MGEKEVPQDVPGCVCAHEVAAARASLRSHAPWKTFEGGISRWCHRLKKERAVVVLPWGSKRLVTIYLLEVCATLYNSYYPNPTNLVIGYLDPPGYIMRKDPHCQA